MVFSAQTLVLMADGLLVVHSLIVAFVVLLPPLVWAGYAMDWHWVRYRPLRLVHLLAMLVVLCQALLGRLCPLTIWEQHLRRAAGEAAYQGSFVQHHLEDLIYWSVPQWAFLLLYALFTGLVILVWRRYPPSPPN